MYKAKANKSLEEEEMCQAKAYKSLDEKEMCTRLRPTNPLKRKRCVRLRPTNPLKIELAAKLTNSESKEPCGFAKRFFEKLRTLCLATRFLERLNKNLLFSQKIP